MKKKEVKEKTASIWSKTFSVNGASPERRRGLPQKVVDTNTELTAWCNQHIGAGRLTPNDIISITSVSNPETGEIVVTVYYASQKVMPVLPGESGGEPTEESA